MQRSERDDFAASDYKYERQNSSSKLPSHDVSAFPWDVDIRHESAPTPRSGASTTYLNHDEEFELLPLVDQPKFESTPKAITRKSVPLQQPYGLELTPRLWTPLILHKPVLLGLALLFLLMIVALEILYYFSNRNQGVSTGNPNDHYLWTYGPTACILPFPVGW